MSIDEAKIEADARWDELKSYVTNTDIAATDVIEQYHGLWVVERAFRITKGSLEARPIFHVTERRIEIHICICFVAYKLYKELERLLRMLSIHLSVNKALDINKTTSTITVELPDGTQYTRIMLMTEEQRQLQPLLPSNF